MKILLCLLACFFLNAQFAYSRERNDRNLYEKNWMRQRQQAEREALHERSGTEGPYYDAQENYPYPYSGPFPNSSPTYSYPPQEEGEYPYWE